MLKQTQKGNITKNMYTHTNGAYAITAHFIEVTPNLVQCVLFTRIYLYTIYACVFVHALAPIWASVSGSRCFALIVGRRRRTCHSAQCFCCCCCFKEMHILLKDYCWRVHAWPRSVATYGFGGKGEFVCLSELDIGKHRETGHVCHMQSIFTFK